ncbi:hypothetical protein D3C86_2167890 [compost metagenome]
MIVTFCAAAADSWIAAAITGAAVMASVCEVPFLGFIKMPSSVMPPMIKSDVRSIAASGIS